MHTHSTPMTIRDWQDFVFYRAMPDGPEKVAAKRRLMERWWPLTTYLARRFCEARGIRECGDAAGYGAVGLSQAIDRFDPDNGASFVTFGGRRIVGAILDGFRGEDWVPRRERTKSDRVPQIVAFTDKFRRAAERIGKAELRDALEEGELAMSAPDARQDDSVDWFDWCIRGLLPREKLVMRCIYLSDMTMKQAGGVAGISESRVSQIHARVMPLLRSRIEQEGIAA